MFHRIGRVLAITCAVGVFAIQGSAQSPSTPSPMYEEVKGWGPIPKPAPLAWELGRVATDAKGDTIYAFRRSDPPIVELDASGKVLKMWGDGMFVWPHGMQVDGQGNLWVTDAAVGPGAGSASFLAPRIPSALAAGRGHQVFKFSRTGQLLLTLGTKGVAGDGPTEFNGPADVIVGKNGDIFVADGHRNNRIVKFTKDGKFIKTWGKKGTGPGDFQEPHALALDSQGRLFVGDRQNKRIQIFDQDGRFLDQWGQYGGPSGLSITPDDTLYVTDQSRKIITVGSARTGKITAVLEGIWAEGVTADAKHTIYAGEVVDRSFRKFVRK